jgi:hypothetical protein
MTATESLLPEIINDFFNKIGTKLPFAAFKTAPAFWGTAVEKCSR